MAWLLYVATPRGAAPQKILEGEEAPFISAAIKGKVLAQHRLLPDEMGLTLPMLVKLYPPPKPRPDASVPAILPQPLSPAPAGAAEPVLEGV